MMKNKYLIIVVTFALLSILVLQSSWLYSTFFLVRDNISEEINGIFDNSVRIEAENRLMQTPKGTRIKSGSVNDSIPKITYLEQGLFELGYPLSVDKIDSIAYSFFKDIYVKDRYTIHLIDLNTNVVLDESKSGSENDFSFLTSIKSKIIPVRTDLSEGVQLVVLNPHIIIFKRMFILILFTLIMILIAFYGLFYQVRLIYLERKINSLKEDFSNAMVHDMKTPLHNIYASIDLLHMSLKDIDFKSKEKLFYNIQGSITHLLSLLNRILTLFKLESGKLIINRSSFSLVSIIDELKNEFILKSAKKILFEIDLKTDIIFADEELLKESISNLIDNSIKYSNESVKITISSFSDAKYTIIKVRDNGIGISLKDQQLIFNKFERASTIYAANEKKVGGFGLGLNYVFQVMHIHGGKVTVDSVIDEFTEFSLYIPKI